MHDALAKLLELERDEIARHVGDLRIDGLVAQVATVTLNAGQSMWVSKGGLLGYSDGITWVLKVPSGGVGKAVGRMMTGEGASLAWVTSSKDGATVVVSANQPGRLATWNLEHGSITCTSGSFVGAVGQVDIDVTTARSAGAALFGGAGLFLQKLSGSGVVLINGAGDFIPRQLAAGETYLVSTGNLAVFSSEVQYGVRGVGGCAKALFGGEGLFMTELTGPGWLMMQSLKKLPTKQ